MFIWSEIVSYWQFIISLYDLLYVIMYGEIICCILLKLRIVDNRIVKLKIDLFEFIYYDFDINKNV